MSVVSGISVGDAGSEPSELVLASENLDVREPGRECGEIVRHAKLHCRRVAGHDHGRQRILVDLRDQIRPDIDLECIRLGGRPVAHLHGDIGESAFSSAILQDELGARYRLAQQVRRCGGSGGEYGLHGVSQPRGGSRGFRQHLCIDNADELFRGRGRRRRGRIIVGIGNVALHRRADAIAVCIEIRQLCNRLRDSEALRHFSKDREPPILGIEAGVVAEVDEPLARRGIRIPGDFGHGERAWIIRPRGTGFVVDRRENRNVRGRRGHFEAAALQHKVMAGAMEDGPVVIAQRIGVIQVAQEVLHRERSQVVVKLEFDHTRLQSRRVRRRIVVG